MDGAITQVLSALLVLAALAIMISSLIRGRTLPQRVEARPDGRVWLYRNFLLRMWPLMLLPAAIVLTSDRVTARDLGWAWPHGGAGYLFAGYYLFLSVGAAVRIRRLMRRGHMIPQRGRVAFMVPRTTRERWWAAALSVTAGVTEETLFRGGLLAVGTKVCHLPSPTVVAAALVLFAASHLYQGWRGVIGSAVVGLVFTVVFIVSGSLLLAVIAHTVHDLITMLLIPAAPTPQPPAAEPAPQPSAAEPAPQPSAAEPAPQPSATEPAPQPPAAEPAPQPSAAEPAPAEGGKPLEPPRFSTPSSTTVTAPRLRPPAPAERPTAP